MQRARTLFDAHRKQALNGGILVRTATGGRHLGWHQWLYQWGVGAPPPGHRSEVSRWLDDRGDTQYEHVWTRTAWSYRDFIIEKSLPAVRLALYYHLALF